MSRKVSIETTNTELEWREGKTLLEELTAAGHYIKSSCGGHGSCADCVLRVIEGKENLSDMTTPEKMLLGNVFHITKERLSCQLEATGPITVDISNHDQQRDQEHMRNKKHNPRKK